MNLARRDRSLNLTIHSSFIQIELLGRPSQTDCRAAFDAIAHLFDVAGTDASYLKRGGGIFVPRLANTDQVHFSSRVLTGCGFYVTVLEGRTAYEAGDAFLT